MTLGTAEPEREAAAIPALGPGHQLSIAREAANLTLSDVASYLHLDIKTIEALEHDEYEQLPAPMFVRGYLRGYARLLKLRPEPILEAFDHNGLGPPPLVADIADETQAHSSDFPVRVFTYLVIGGLAVLVVLWWQNQNSDPLGNWQSLNTTTTPLNPEIPGIAPSAAAKVTAGALDAEQTNEPVAPIAVSIAETAQSLVDEELAVSQLVPLGDNPLIASLDQSTGQSGVPPAETGSESESTDITTAEVTPVAQLDAPVVAETSGQSNLAQVNSAAESEQSVEAAVDAPAPLAVVEPSPTEPSPATALSQLTRVGDPAGKDEVVLRFGHESWVEVHDRDNQRLFYNLVHPGAILEVQGNAPMAVLLGYVKDTEVMFNGARFDFSPFISKGIARFTLGGVAAPQPEPQTVAPTSTQVSVELTATSPGTSPATNVTQLPVAPQLSEPAQPNTTGAFVEDATTSRR